MDKYFTILIRIIGLAILWATGGYMIGAALETIGFTGYPYPIIVASLNVIFGLLLFKSMISYQFIDEAFFDKAFFERAKPNDSGYVIAQGLWFLPCLAIILGASMWFWAIILRLILPK